MTTNTRLMTADELIALPHGKHRYELVKGELLIMSPSGEEYGAAIGNLTILLGQFVKANNPGILYGAETGFKLGSDPDTVLAPDIAFIRRVRLGRRSKGYRLGAPDLVVEVLSPSDHKKKVERTTAQWLELGAKKRFGWWILTPGPSKFTPRTLKRQSFKRTRN
ncbi:MAG TPA: Uma2 family endonuclease [Pyrinomonadaceae bacterium]|nr:Uma2 family endonuclease [Pyrinomonadaceae bacterium]